MKLVLKVDEGSLQRAVRLLEQALEGGLLGELFRIVVMRQEATKEDEMTLWLGLEPTERLQAFLKKDPHEGIW